MLVAGDQGEAWKAWQEVGKRGGQCGNDRGANRGARRGREHDFHNRRSRCGPDERNAAHIATPSFIIQHRHLSRTAVVSSRLLLAFDVLAQAGSAGEGVNDEWLNLRHDERGGDRGTRTRADARSRSASLRFAFFTQQRETSLDGAVFAQNLASRIALCLGTFAHVGIQPSTCSSLRSSTVKLSTASPRIDLKCQRRRTPRKRHRVAALTRSRTCVTSSYRAANGSSWNTCTTLSRYASQ